MKSLRKVAVVIALSVVSLFSANAQGVEVTTGVDLYSTYVWRGTAFSGPSIQPAIDFSMGGFSIGAWGSQGYDGFQEMDLYASYSFDFGLSLGLTDYYYPLGDSTANSFFEFDDKVSSHALEINLGYEIGSLSLSANYILNDASDGGAANAGGDIYCELGYSFEKFDVFVGGGDGWHTSTGDFQVCNVGVSSSKEVKITDSFSLPISGSAILNPEKEQFLIVVGISL